MRDPNRHILARQASFKDQSSWPVAFLEDATDIRGQQFDHILRRTARTTYCKLSHISNSIEKSFGGVGKKIIEAIDVGQSFESSGLSLPEFKVETFIELTMYRVAQLSSHGREVTEPGVHIIAW